MRITFCIRFSIYCGYKYGSKFTIAELSVSHANHLHTLDKGNGVCIDMGGQFLWDLQRQWNVELGC